ncbi:heavy metal translocating P-type ATPase [Maricaulaceae bacterium MS644]
MAALEGDQAKWDPVRRSDHPATEDQGDQAKWDPVRRSDHPAATGDAGYSAREEAGAHVRLTDAARDLKSLDLAVEGARCAACIQKIEGALTRMDGVKQARLNLSTGRLAVRFSGADERAGDFIAALDRIGYPARPYAAETVKDAQSREEKRLLRALGVAGFAMMNVMLLSISVWAGEGEMDLATKTLMHWISGLIALPAVAYSGAPFFKSAWKSLSARQVNMDVPISLAVLLACGLSVYETAMGHGAAYFDAAVMLLFFLLIGRWLDVRLRARAGQAARDLAALQARIAHRIGADGHVKAVPAADIRPGDRLLVQPGERFAVDGIIVSGQGPVDSSLVTGETAPLDLKPGGEAWSGMVNLSRPLTLEATAASADSLLAEIARLVEAGEQSRSKYVRYADLAARAYVPAVFAMAGLTLLGWLAVGGSPHDAVMNAIAVLIITCPCAMALVAPAVQVVACGRLFQAGVLVKSGDALERLADADYALFDKTGTLSEGKPVLVNAGDVSTADLALAAQLARASRHPLSRAVVAAAEQASGPGAVAEDVREEAGGGLSAVIDGRPVRFGSADFTGADTTTEPDAALEAWLAVDGRAPVRFIFADRLRQGAAEAVAALQARGLPGEMLSGDRAAPVAEAAAALGLARFSAGLKPQDKIARIEALKAQGFKPLMVGDGINDAPALSAAHVSISMGSAADISRSAADLVIQGDRLESLVRARDVARASRSRMMENFALANIYNAIAVPLAVFGLVNPLVAALAMSSSSIVVMLNALRLARA